VNHIAEKQENPAAETITATGAAYPTPIWLMALVFIAMIVHALVAYADRPFQTNILLELLFGAVNFVVVLIMYFGISRAAFSRQFMFLSISAAIAITVGVVFTRQIPAMSMAAGWLAILLTSVMCGVLSARRITLPKVFAAALGVLVMFVGIQLFPLWTKLFESAAELTNLVMSDLSDSLIAMGYSDSTIQNITEQFRVFYEALLRILPSLSLLAAMFQFSIGFWLFAHWLKRNSGNQYSFPEFILWKAPFAMTALVLAGVLMRLFGNDIVTLIADNLITILAVVYSITGIALLEFFMKKFRFGVISRFLIYLLLLLTHVIGFAFLALAGFVDSFFEWRRKYPLPLDYKTG
jgi:hypothetical protein